MAYPEVLVALANPTRRSIVNRLRLEARSASEMARPLKISRSAVTQHLRILFNAGLVSYELEGSRTMYHLTRRGFDQLREYLDGLEGLKGFRA
jgi:DNA-binding transcriptional ArsR family regulator